MLGRSGIDLLRELRDMGSPARVILYAQEMRPRVTRQFGGGTVCRDHLLTLRLGATTALVRSRCTRK